MKYLRLLLCLVAFSLALTSCQTFYTTETDGTAILGANGFRLPSSIGAFQRVYITAFDGSGHNMGAGYNYYFSREKAALTVFVLSASDGSAPTESQLKQYFDASRQEVLRAHANPDEIRTTKSAGHYSGGSLGEFRYDEVFAHSHQRVASFLAVFRDGNRLVKYRMTGPESERDQLRGRLIQTIGTLSKIN